MFRIEDHVLTSETIDVRFLGIGGAPIDPELIVIHYGVTDNISALVAAQRSRGYWAHLSIDGFVEGSRGAVYQVVQASPFNVRGTHAGASVWRGRSGCNAFSIGIEIANPGPLIRDRDGILRTVYGKAWPDADALELPIPAGYPRTWTHWAQFSDQEIDLCVGICHLLKERYPIADIRGHSEIAPGRKFDPGPAFPIDWLRSKIL